MPDGLQAGEKRPAIVMAHGWSAVKEMYLDAFAAKFANAGFVATVFDYRNFGDSEGESATNTQVRQIEPAQREAQPEGMGHPRWWSPAS